MIARLIRSATFSDCYLRPAAWVCSAVAVAHYAPLLDFPVFRGSATVIIVNDQRLSADLPPSAAGPFIAA